MADNSVAGVKGSVEAGGVDEAPRVVSAASVLFPGEVVTLSNGARLTVKPWGVRALSRDIPEIVGRLIGKLGGQAGASTESVVATIITGSMGEVLDLVAYTCGVDKEAVLLADDVLAEDVMRLLVATVRQNRGFFAGLAELRTELGADLLPGKKRDGTR